MTTGYINEEIFELSIFVDGDIQAEEELGFRLPPSYRWWLVHYGNARLNGGNILEIAAPEHREYYDGDLFTYTD